MNIATSINIDKDVNMNMNITMIVSSIIHTYWNFAWLQL